LAASSDFSVIIDRDWPVRSCMSRASRSLSSLVASLATVSRAWASSRIKVSCIRNPIIARPMSRTGIKTARVLARSRWVIRQHTR
jgi:hypothetical protein